VLEDMEQYLPEGTPKDLKKKVVVVSEEDRLSDEFKAPCKYYIIDAFGNGVYFKTRSRLTASALSDKIYGNGFFTVKQVVKAIAR